MASPLLNLPLEVLQAIIEEAMPESFENIAVTSRDLYAASVRFLTDYNHRRKMFYHFVCSSLIKTSPDEFQMKPVSEETGYIILDCKQLLEVFVEEPSLCRYIHSINMNSGVPRAQRSRRVHPLLVGRPGISPRLEDFIRSSQELNALEANRDTWREKMGTDLISGANLHTPWGDIPDTQRVDLFLLTMLTPTVRFIQLPFNWHLILFEQRFAPEAIALMHYLFFDSEDPRAPHMQCLEMVLDDGKGRATRQVNRSRTPCRYSFASNMERINNPKSVSKDEKTGVATLGKRQRKPAKTGEERYGGPRASLKW